MNWKIKTRPASIILMLFLISGCAAVPIQTYVGPEKPDSEIAHITGGAMIGDYLFKVDEEIGPVSSAGMRQYNSRGGKYDVTVLPGDHVLEFVGLPVPPPYKITFRAEAGKRYTVSEEKGVYKISDGKTEISFSKENVPAYQEPTQKNAAILVQKSTVSLPFMENFGISLYRIDGKYPTLPEKNYYRFNDRWNGSLEVKLSPGEHLLEYTIHGRNAYSIGGVRQKVTVEAGKRYTFKLVRTDEKTAMARIFNQSSPFGVLTELVEDK